MGRREKGRGQRLDRESYSLIVRVCDEILAGQHQDMFPSAMHTATAVNVKRRLTPAVQQLRDAIRAKAEEWKDIVKIGCTHMQDATPLTLGQKVWICGNAGRRCGTDRGCS
jgi:fumarate hydratase class II